MTRQFERAAPPKVLMHPINDQGGGQYRILQPASLLRRNGFAVAQAHRQTVVDDALKVLDPDIVVFQLWQTDNQIETIKRYRKALPKAHFVYEIDDLFWAVPEGSYHRNNPLLPQSRSQIRTAAKLCNSIVCSTWALANEMKSLTGVRDVRVQRNEVTRHFINSALSGRRSIDNKPDKPRVGWAGGIGHGGDLAIISEVMKLLGDEVTWVFLGMVPPGVDPSTVESYPGVPFENYPAALGRLNLDLALAPLEDNAFNRCKSDLRVIEYGAAGFPVLASEISTYVETPVWMVKNTPEDWAAAIRDALSNRERLDAYAEHLHGWVTANRCMDENLGSWLKTLLPKNSHPFIPNAHTSHVGKMVTVGGRVDGLECFPTVTQAWRDSPGADILYLREGLVLSPAEAMRMAESMGTNASAAALSNDGMYPVFGKFIRLPDTVATRIKAAAAVAGNNPIAAPFPSGPCVLLSGPALARFGLPDVNRFGHLEFALADWGSRCSEGGRGHVTVCDVYVSVADGLSQAPELAKRALDHLQMWVPGFVNLIFAFQQGDALAGVKEDLDLAYNAMFFDAINSKNYTEWAETYDSIGPADRQAMVSEIDQWDSRPHINVVMPTFNTPVRYLQAAVESVLGQTYPNWSLLIADDASSDPETLAYLTSLLDSDDRIKIERRTENGHICHASNTALEMADDGWVVFLDHDDMLAPHALYTIAREIREHPEARFIYSDSDKTDESGQRVDPYYAPDFSYELLLAQNYVTHISAYRLDGIRAVGNLRPGMEGSQDWDLALRYIEAECGTPPDTGLIRHIPQVLYHWRQAETSTASNIMNKPYAVEAGRKAVMEHLHRTKQAAFVGQNPVVPIFNLVRFLVPDPAPKVTVIIPTKDNPEQITRCVGSLMANTVYGNFDVIVVDTGSTSFDGKSVLNRLVSTPNVRVLKMPGKFNYAAVNNYAAQMTDAEFLCLLNDDTEIIERSWLNDMVGLAMREKVGAVGAKLIYPDGTVQHGGIMFSGDQPPGLSAMHLWQKMPVFAPGQAGRAVITQPVIAVTGACMVVRKSVYDEFGGLDAETFPIDYNDVDFCLRLHKAGYRNIICAQALVRHLEGSTKKREKTWLRAEMLEAESRLLGLHGEVRDPYLNPNLDFQPNLSTLVAAPPAKPWQSADRVRTLLVNGDEEAARRAFRDGLLPFSASLEGHYLAFTNPTMPHVQPIDTRETVDRLITVLQKLCIESVTFCGIGDGTLGAVGFFTALADHGWPVKFNPTENANIEDEHGYYTPAGWAAVWNRFLESVKAGEWVRPAAE